MIEDRFVVRPHLCADRPRAPDVRQNFFDLATPYFDRNLVQQDYLLTRVDAH